MTLTIAPAAWATSTTARMSASTSASRPDLRAPIWMTMSSSRAPSPSARSVSKTLVAVRWLPCGKPIVVPTATSVPSRICRGPDDSAGRTQPTPRRTRREPAAVLDERIVQLRPEQRVVDRLGDVAVGQGGDREGRLGHVHSLDVRPQDVARQQEAALDQLVRPLEAAVLVLDDAVAVVARAVQLRRTRPQSTSPRPGRRGICQPMPARRSRARTGRRGRSSGPWPGSGGCAGRTRG